MPEVFSDAERAELARAIADVALLHGEFTLRSGRTSRYYLDKYLFETRPEVLRRVGALLAEHVRAMSAQAGGVDRLAGAELGGIPLVTVASLETGLPSVLVRNARKDYGTSKQIEGTLNEGERVIFVEDVVTSGGQSIEAVRTLRGMDAEVVGVIATLDRLEGARNAIEDEGVVFDALFNKHDLGIDE